MYASIYHLDPPDGSQKQAFRVDDGSFGGLPGSAPSNKFLAIPTMPMTSDSASSGVARRFGGLIEELWRVEKVAVDDFTAKTRCRTRKYDSRYYVPAFPVQVLQPHSFGPPSQGSTMPTSSSGAS